MTQDTRKDRRVKIVSLNVRYKSATVDEFIENHAHDVSRGGIYIKTANPFPSGTLLKFEIRLASDLAVIAGVGRVVWKRDAGTANTDRPAGMGVKFIKIDEASKGVIDKLVNTKSDAGKAYESESDTSSEAEVKPAAAAAAAKSAPAPATKPPPPEPKLTPLGGISATPRKATVMGMGSVPAAAMAAVSDVSVPKAAAMKAAGMGGGMFPQTHSEAEMPPKQEQTVMKQAAELLEEALREAGGSMDEIGHNPLFAGAKADSKPEVKAASARPPAEPDSAKPASAPSLAAAIAPPNDDAAKARAMVAEMSPAPKKATSDPPRASNDTPSAKRSSAPPARATAAPKKSGNGSVVAVIAAIVVVAGGVAMFRDKLFGSSEAPPSAPAVVAPPAPSPTVTATIPAPTVMATAIESASAAPSAEPTASVTASASAAAAPTPPAAPKPEPKPARPTPTAAPPTTATSDEAPAAPTKPTAAATAAAPTTPPAAPKPKPAAKPTDDNPY